ncbi:hypothetical protein V2J09_020919 [Rumex salicifolius]
MVGINPSRAPPPSLRPLLCSLRSLLRMVFGMEIGPCPRSSGARGLWTTEKGEEAEASYSSPIFSNLQLLGRSKTSLSMCQKRGRQLKSNAHNLSQKKGKQVVESMQERATKIMKKLKRPATSMKNDSRALVIAEPAREDVGVVNPPKKKARKESFKSLKSKYELFCTRSTPNIICEFLQALKPEQKKYIHEMSFGPMFELDIKELPTRICHWVLKHFDTVSYTMMIRPKDIEIMITPYEAYRYLGMPDGLKKNQTLQINQ